jgi:hypothetical protein
MAVKQPIVRADSDWFEAILPDGKRIKVRFTLEGQNAIAAIIARLVAGGL